MTAGHAIFPPSAASRWMTCTGSYALSLQMPPGTDTGSEFAIEGTRLHDVAAQVLTKPKQPMSDSGYVKRYGKLPPEPIGNPDDYMFLMPYLDYAEKRMKKAAVVRIEERIEHSQLLGGTPDLMLMFDDLTEVVDLKTGAGIIVEPEENKQLMTYGYMALKRQMRFGSPVPQQVRLTIVQPPDEDKPVKSWDTTLLRVMEHGDAAEAAIQTAIEGRGTLVVGGHCRFCPAKPICPALRGEVDYGLREALPATLSTAKLGEWLDRLDRLEQFTKAVREVGHEVATLAARMGKPGIPGWGLRPKKAMRSWADEEKVIEIARKRKIKIWQDKLLSPAMAEKVHPNLPEELRSQIVAVSSGMNLVKLTAEEAAQAREVKGPEDGSKMDRLKANFALLKHRR